MARLHRASGAIDRLTHAMKAPEKAIEAAVREIGTQGTRLALSALHPALRLPVELAIWSTREPWAVTSASGDERSPGGS